MSAAGWEPAEPPKPQENSLVQLEILYVLGERGPLSGRGLREALAGLHDEFEMCDSGICKHLSELEQRGLIERRRGLTDSREIRNSLTKRGFLIIRRDSERRAGIADAARQRAIEEGAI